jgi:predicted amidophosphoribosyltransferase
VLAAAELLAAPLAAGARELLTGATLVPVPADPGRRRKRGFDHAGLIAAAVARRTDRPLIACLERPRAERQVGAGRQARLASARQAPPQARGAVPPVAVLVDDVHTTGATLEVCARALREAGAEKVHVITATRSVG